MQLWRNTWAKQTALAFQGTGRFGAERVLLASVGIPGLCEDMLGELYNRFHGIDQFDLIGSTKISLVQGVKSTIS